jgi:hypothetical protein
MDLANKQNKTETITGFIALLWVRQMIQYSTQLGQKFVRNPCPTSLLLSFWSIFFIPHCKTHRFLNYKTYALPDWPNFRLEQFNEQKKTAFFETRAVLLLLGMKAKWDEVGARILLGDNTGGEAVMLWLTRFKCVGVWISTGLLCTCTYAHGWPYIYWVPNTAMFNLRRTYLLKSMSVCTDEQAINCTVRKSIPNLSFINYLNKEIIFNCMNFSLYLTENRLIHYKG